ncbi:MAG TPA: complex I subunit 1 family protein [Candidatus Krumholzibacteria bacterium]|nr:complex I subunit 1 family protein [Candidatus Krumholzibacteria bacterium]
MTGLEEIGWTLSKIGFMLGVIIGLLPAMIWAERKGAAYIQDRVGPNRANILGLRLGGLIHPLADVLKLVFKEDVIPAGVNRFFYHLAPFLVMVVALLTFAVIPFGDKLYLGDQVINLQVADLNVGVLYILAITSLGVYGIVLAGWASNNKYSFLGGIRSTSQMISYEINMGLAVLSLILATGTVRLSDMVQGQGELLFGFLPAWGVVIQPVGFLIFIVALFAEVNRNPFDLPEGESELVSGYHTEYSSLKFALFFMAEYANMIVGAAIVATLYFGGWQVPWMGTETLRANAGPLLTGTVVVAVALLLLFTRALFRHYGQIRYTLGDRREKEPLVIGVVFLAAAIGGVLFLIGGRPWAIEPGSPASMHYATATQVGTFVLKTIFFAWLFIWVRWTLPRFRYDQLMRLGWNFMLPLALVNFFVTAFVVLLLES